MDKRQPGEIALDTLIQELKRQLLPILAVPKRYMNEQEASRYLGGLSVHSLRQWRSKATGPDYLRIGARVVYDVKDLDLWVEKYRIKGDG